jgi:ABC-type multidrug transport system ATPase subunit
LKGITCSKARKATVDALLEPTNLAAVRKQRLGGFSGGMRQRFGIAQALIGNPKLLIVDEPTAGLDPEARVRFHNLLADIGRDVIVILSTHIVDDVADLCPRFAVISKGRVLLAGEPRETIARVKGRIWERVVDRDQLAAVSGSVPVVSTRLQAGRTVVRAYGESSPGTGFEPAPADLEDVYFSTVAGHLAAANA